MTPYTRYNDQTPNPDIKSDEGGQPRECMFSARIEHRAWQVLTTPNTLRHSFYPWKNRWKLTSYKNLHRNVYSSCIQDLEATKMAFSRLIAGPRHTQRTNSGEWGESLSERLEKRSPPERKGHLECRVDPEGWEWTPGWLLAPGSVEFGEWPLGFSDRD